jgi:hypothetical protein
MADLIPTRNGSCGATDPNSRTPDRLRAIRDKPGRRVRRQLDRPTMRTA